MDETNRAPDDPADPEGASEPAEATNAAAAASGSGGPGDTTPLSAAQLLIFFASLTLILLVLYRPALEGLPVSDDAMYVFTNPYTTKLSAASLAAMLDPFGGARDYFLHYNPLQHILHALEYRAFGSDMLGYHVVNVVLHALNVVLLLLLFEASRIPRRAALLGALLFAFHPANVEAVAWISQLKTLSSFALLLGALLALRARPALGTLLFGLALFAKGTALVGLPVAAALTWARNGRPGGSGRHWFWLGAWSVVIGLWWWPSTVATAWTGDVLGRYPDLDTHAGSILSYATRYLVMAATSQGVSAFHDPPSVTLTHPLALAALPAALLMGWRILASLHRRSEEAAYWILAAGSFVMVSQFIPFAYAMGDRYLYYMLPGLIGGGLLFGLEVLPRLGALVEARGLPIPSRATLARVATVGVALVCLLFAARSNVRANFWVDMNRLLIDSANHYPESGTADYARARRAAQAGDVDETVRWLRSAKDKSLFKIKNFHRDPYMAPVRNDPAFDAYVREFARSVLEFGNVHRHDSPMWYEAMAEAHFLLQDYDAAIEMLERSARHTGPNQASALMKIDMVKQQRALVEGGNAPDPDDVMDLLNPDPLNEFMPPPSPDL